MPQLLSVKRPEEMGEAEKRLESVRERLKRSAQKQGKGPLGMKALEGEAIAANAQKKLKELKAEAKSLEKKHLADPSVPLEQREGEKLGQAVKDVAELGEKVRSVRGEVEGLEKDADAIERKEDELANSDKDRLLEELKRQGEAATAQAKGERELEAEKARLGAMVSETDGLARELEKIEEKTHQLKEKAGPRLPKKVKSQDERVKATRADVEKAQKLGEALKAKLQAVEEALEDASGSGAAAAAGKRSPNAAKVAKAMKELDEARREADELKTRTKEAAKKVELAGNSCEGLEKELKTAVSEEIQKALATNEAELGKAKEALDESDKRMARMRAEADDALKRVSPKSGEAKKLEELREAVREREQMARDIEKRKHKEEADARKTRERVKSGPGLDGLLRIANQEVPENASDCQGVKADAEQLRESLNGLEGALKDERKKSAAKKAKELRDRLQKARQQQLDVGDKTRDFEREAKRLEEALEQAIAGTSDPQVKASLAHQKARLKEPLGAEAKALAKKVAPIDKDIAKLEQQLVALEANPESPSVLEDMEALGERIAPTESGLNEAEKKIDELTSQLRPIERAADNANRAMGETLRAAERGLAGVEDDLGELDEKHARIEKKLKATEAALEEGKSLAPDKEREEAEKKLQAEHENEARALDELKRQKQALQKKAASLKKMVESAKDAAGKDKPAGKQGFSPEALQAQIDKAEKEAEDAKKKANALDADVDETKDKLDAARQAFLRKMGVLAQAQKKAEDDLKETERLARERVPEVSRKVDEAKKRLDALSAVAGAQSPEQAQRVEELRKALEKGQSELSQKMKPEALKLEEGVQSRGAMLRAVPVKVVPVEQVEEVAAQLEEHSTQRKQLESGVAEPERLADEASRLADELERHKKGQDELDNKLLAKDIEGKLEATQKELDDTKAQLSEVEKELAKEDVPKEARERLEEEAEKLMEKTKELERKKDLMEKRLKDALAVSPDEAAKAKKMLEAVAQDVDNLEEDSKKGSERAKKLADELAKARKREKTQADLKALVEVRGGLNDRVEQILARAEKKRRSLERAQEALAGSADHREQQDATARLKAKLLETKKEAERIAQEKKKLDSKWKPIAETANYAGQLDVFELDEVKLEADGEVEKLRKLEAEAEAVERGLDKRRAKIGDAKVPQLLSVKRPEEMGEAEKRLESVRERLKRSAQKQGKGPLGMKALEGEAIAANAQKKLKELKAEAKSLEKKHLADPSVPLEQREGEKLGQAVKDVAELGEKVRSVRGEVEGLEKDADAIERKEDELANSDKDRLLEELKRQGEAATAQAKGERELEAEKARLGAMVSETDGLARELEKIEEKTHQLKEKAGPRLPKKVKSQDERVKATRADVEKAQKLGEALKAKLQAVEEALEDASGSGAAAAAGKRSPNAAKVAKAMKELDEARREADELKTRTKEAAKKVELAGNSCEGLEKELKTAVSEEIQKALATNEAELGKAKEALDESDKRMARMRAEADDALKRVSPKSGEAKKLEELREAVREREQMARDIEKRKHKEEADARKTRERVKSGPGLDGLLRIANQEVPENASDCQGVKADAEQLRESLNGLEGALKDERKKSAAKKAKELRDRLQKARQQQLDVGDKTRDFEREAKRLEEALEQAIAGTSDPQVKASLAHQKARLKEPLGAEAKALAKKVAPIDKDIAKLEQQLVALEANPESPSVLEDMEALGERIAPTESGLNEAEKKIDELTSQLRPIERAADNANRAMGETLRAAERGLAGVEDDLGELDEKHARIEKKLKATEAALEEGKSLAPDKEREEAEKKLQAEHENEARALDELKRQKQALQKKAASLKKMVESAKDAAGKDKPAGKQGFSPEALQAQIDKAEKEAEDAKKKANALDADVDETKDKLDAARQAFLRKMGVLAQAQQKSH